ncbi:MAG: CDP-alcohol phosphatidyltransferase family protein [Flavobacteriaceae bacterium]|jgi:CDP-diacylglycerol--serine O-phosphatidyltransferase|nr:phosphatidylserine synthase [Flavobacteriaceae bacterium]MDG1028870.1 CDP-alcohol phosphatidyltransferase family protein [Flavobacteriaceae bacterium]|tara:strand:- start:121 stop:861 length:741 start_codon:yes stop_codon:yes gene_type:complete
MIKKSVPHFFTSLNLLSGCFSIYFAYIFQFETALFFLLAGVFFDVWDGLFARLLKVESELGVQLDSMADLVTCGVAPGIILAQLFVMAGNKPVEIIIGWPLNAVVEFIPWVFIGFLIPLGAAFRLARFNIEGADKNHFIGLPTPAMAMFFGALPLLVKHPDFSFLQPVLISNPGLIFLTLIFVLLMNAQFDLFSFKSLKTGRLDSILRMLLLIFAPVLIYCFGLGGISLGVLIYLLLNLINNSFSR